MEEPISRENLSVNTLVRTFILLCIESELEPETILIYNTFSGSFRFLSVPRIENRI